MRLLISRSLRLCSYLAPFVRYGDLLAKNCLFLLLLSHSALSLPVPVVLIKSTDNRTRGHDLKLIKLTSSVDATKY